MGRSPCCDKVGLKKGPWTTEEDQKLLTYIQEHGHGSWRALPPKAGLQRCGKSCRLRWTNYLRPDIKRGEFSLQEQQTIIQLHALLGNRWSAIASHLPKRTDNEIKNYWNTHLKKRLAKMGIDPTTHRPRSHATRPKDMAHLTHMAQWEMARLEAEARIVKGSNPDRRRSPTFARPPVHVAAPRPPCLDILKVWRGTWQAKGKNEISFDGFYPSHQLESPTSILNFSDNVVNNSVNRDLSTIHENTLYAGVNYEALGGIMGNSDMQVRGVALADVPGTSSANCLTDSMRFPGFLESENVGFIEDSHKINYWSNILDAVGSPIDSSLVF